MKPMTDKERSKVIAKMVKIANSWLNKGFSLEQVERGLWNSFGYNTARFDDRLEIRSRGADFKIYATIYAK